MSEHKKIISIDGGGTGGVFMFHIIKKIMSHMTISPDLIVGVSAGAIVGAMLATGQMEKLSNDKIEEYIKRVFESENKKGPWFRPKYKGAEKSNLLNEIFGNTLLSEVAIDMAIIVDVIDGEPVILTTWEHGHIPLCAALDSTSAVPVLFPPVTIDGKQYVDGGTVTTSPTCIATLLGLQKFKVPISRLDVCSIGLPTRSPTSNKFKNSDMGIVQWLSLGIPTKLFAQRSYLENMLISQLLGGRYLRIESSHYSRIDDINMLTPYLTDAGEVWDKQKADIIEFFDGS
jgi:predicted acylesterase/phospholipase RssA